MLTLHDAGRRVGDRWLWRHLSFSLESGRSLGLAGPSGSGKTLLLRALVGLDRLDEGEARLEDRPLVEWELPRYRCRVLYLPPSPALEEGTVEDNLRLPFSFRVRRARRFEPDRAKELLERLGAGALWEREVGDLSSGERQRVGFARALLLEPQVLLLDEPTAHVDPERASEMEEMVGEWRAGERSVGQDRAAMWTSHDAAQLARVTDRRIDLEEFQEDR